MKLFVAKIIWYCDGEDGPQTDYLVVAGDDFTDALRELENRTGRKVVSSKNSKNPRLLDENLK